MRPIKLSMTAFGPFIATETVDFEVFGERPLFLINGATGGARPPYWMRFVLLCMDKRQVKSVKLFKCVVIMRMIIRQPQ